MSRWIGVGHLFAPADCWTGQLSRPFTGAYFILHDRLNVCSSVLLAVAVSTVSVLLFSCWCCHLETEMQQLQATLLAGMDLVAATQCGFAYPEL